MSFSGPIPVPGSGMPGPHGDMTPAPGAPPDRYGGDVLAHDPHARPASRPVEARPGLLIEDVQSGFVGEIVDVRRRAGKWQMQLEGARGVRREFPLGPGYWIEGQPVRLLPPGLSGRGAAPKHPAINASGSIHVEQRRARVARESRIWVEGKHDAQLIEKVWGEDLRLEGVVVEELLGVDNLEEKMAEFGPTRARRAGVLVDHLVPGSKESRIAAQAAAHPGILIVGHPYVDVWQAVKPSVVGLRAWPDVPKGEDIKRGTLRRIGWPYETAEDVGLGWARILERVHTYRDLEPSLLGRVEELIDFVTAPATD